MRSVAIFLLLILCVAAATQETKHPPARRTVETGEAAKPAAAQAEIAALTADVARMRAILHQMEMNLAFLPAGQTPAKHQFELEVDMWRALLDHMDHQLEALRAPSSSK